jgi:hypothetical protein
MSKKPVAEIGKNVTAIQGDVASLSNLDRFYGAVKKHQRPDCRPRADNCEERVTR